MLHRGNHAIVVSKSPIAHQGCTASPTSIFGTRYGILLGEKKACRLISNGGTWCSRGSRGHARRTCPNYSGATRPTRSPDARNIGGGAKRDTLCNVIGLVSDVIKLKFPSPAKFLLEAKRPLHRSCNLEVAG